MFMISPRTLIRETNERQELEKRLKIRSLMFIFGLLSENTFRILR